MEEYPSPQQNKSSGQSFKKTGLFEIVFVLIAFLLLLVALNYFNIFSKKLPPEVIAMCKPYLNVSSKVGCQKAAEFALTDTKGKIVKITSGNLQVGPMLLKNIKLPDNLKVWIIDIQLEKPFTAPNGTSVKALRLQFPINSTKMVFRTPINL